MAIVTSFNDIINFGDKIICKYTALTSGQVGTFSEVGTTTASEIPVAGSATPNGSFYWIYVGKDYEGRKKFIADRNIQSTITYDVLNTAGMTDGLRLSSLSDTTKSLYIRLPTGGISINDKDNEWDKIIIGSTLGGTITAGDDNVWHHSTIYSWTSTTPSGNNTNKTTRAVSTTVRLTSYTSGYFRPVLLVELETSKYLIKQNGNYYTINSSNYDSITNHNFIPLTLTGGATPNETDIKNFGFSSLSLFTSSMNVGSDTFLPFR